MEIPLTNVNDRGQPGTLQRLQYRAVRATTHDEWRVVHALASELLEQEMGKPDPDNNRYLHLLNLICTITHEVRRLQNGLDRIVNREE